MNYYGRKELGNLDHYTVDFDYEAFDPSEIYKLDANEGEYLLDQILAEEISDIVKGLKLNYYPDPNSTKLVSAISSTYGINKEHILPGNGSDDILNMLFTVYSGKRLLLPSFTYPVYTTLSKIHNIQVDTIEISRGDFSLPNDIDAYFDDDVDFFIVSYPNNPTGNCFDETTIERLIIKHPGVLFVIDEAYSEYCDYSFISLINKYKNVIVLRTLSKVFGLAGIRLGFCVACEQMIGTLRKVKLPYNINVISQSLGEYLIPRLYERANSSLQKVKEIRDSLTNDINTIPGFKAFDSSSNFILVETSSHVNVCELIDELKGNNIYLRRLKTSEGDYLRISIMIDFDYGLLKKSLLESTNKNKIDDSSNINLSEGKVEVSTC